VTVDSSTSPSVEPDRSALRTVVERIETIVFDEAEPGSQLPSEGQLAKELGVSRLTVREGVKQLSARGLIETQNGRRPVVAVPNGRSVGDYFRSAIRRDPRALLDLLEVRFALETHIATLAAVNADQAGIREMETTVQEMATHLDDGDEFNEADIRFHELLAAATGSPMLATLIEELSACLRTGRAQSVAGHRRRGLQLDEVLAEHREILEHVGTHDAQGAASAMRRHLQHTKEDLDAALD
jgi:GntR family transcriptional repressor for pyruvate dehydrogenase complex